MNHFADGAAFLFHMVVIAACWPYGLFSAEGRKLIAWSWTMLFIHAERAQR